MCQDTDVANTKTTDTGQDNRDRFNEESAESEPLRIVNSVQVGYHFSDAGVGSSRCDIDHQHNCHESK